MNNIIYEFIDNKEIFLPAIFSIIVILLFSKKKERRLTVVKNKKTDPEYEKKPVMTKTELSVYHSLLSIMPDNLYLLAQVRLCDIVQVNGKLFKPRTGEWQSLFNKISRWHCDFVIINNVGETVCGIELDDFTHRADSRINRDIEFNAIFQKTGITLFRVSKDNAVDVINNHILSHYV
ncbi:DUF2726 domain-containing protein [Morganella morganii]